MDKSSQLTCMYSFMSIQRRFLAKSFHTEITLERPFASMSAHMHFEVRFPAKCSTTNLNSQRNNEIERDKRGEESGVKVLDWVPIVD